jgi:cytochrome c-type biogenesis protein CcmH
LAIRQSMKGNSYSPCKNNLKPRSSGFKGPFTRFGFFFVVLLLLAILALPAAAQDSGGQITDDEVNAIAKDLFCPICESTPLDVCATQACADWREVIRTKLGEGQTEKDIKAYFLDQYGARALAEPPRSGITQWVWFMPILVVTIGGFIFIRFMRQSRGIESEELVTAVKDDSSPAPAETKPDDDDYRSRIESELREINHE